MKAVAVFVLICIAALSTTAKADGRCEKIEDFNLWLGTLKTCNMDSTVIDSKDFQITIGRDESVKGFSAYGNKQLEYFPNNLGEKFPSLLRLSAVWCSIKRVSKNDFKGLGKLQWLYLAGNQIENIDDDTFAYIPAIERIDLSYNKIKKLNGRAFASLYQSMRVDLSHNECINEYFSTATRIAELPRVVTGNCAFTESEPSAPKIVEPEADLMAQSETSLARTSVEGGTWLICLGFLRLAKKILL